MHRILTTLAAPVALLLAGAASAQPAFELIDAGSEPRRELRYRFQEGDSATMVMNMAINAQMTMGAMQIPQGLPALVLRMNLQTTEVGDDGTARFDYELESVESADESGATLPYGLDSVGNTSGWVSIDSRGRTTGSSLTVPDTVAAELSQALDSMAQYVQQLTAPLPEAPVGSGARWEIVADIESGGFSVSQRSVYELVSVDGENASLRVSLTQSAPAQSVAAPGMPPGIEATLRSLEAQGSGTMRIDLRSIVPHSELDLSMAMVMSVALQGLTQEMNVDVESSISIAPAP